MDLETIVYSSYCHITPQDCRNWIAHAKIYPASNLILYIFNVINSNYTIHIINIVVIIVAVHCLMNKLPQGL